MKVKEPQLANKQPKFCTLFTFQFEISGKDFNDEHKLKNFPFE